MPGLSMWDLSWIKWHWSRFYPSNSGFSYQYYFTSAPYAYPLIKKQKHDGDASPKNTHTLLLVAVTGRTMGGDLRTFQKAVFFQMSGSIG